MRVWKILVLLNLVAVLHADMRGERKGRSWGGDTSNLLLADVLNVAAARPEC
jgi:hypothetical protein